MCSGVKKRNWNSHSQTGQKSFIKEDDGRSQSLAEKISEEIEKQGLSMKKL